MSRLMVIAGGTGGHVFPALAVANALRDQSTEVTWLGTRRGLEASIVPANNFAIEWVSVEGLRGKGFVSWLLAPIKLIRALWQSAGAIRRTQPDCVLGMGGFVSGPGGLAARIMGKPLIVHEQNAVAGLTNRCLARIANRVLSGFPRVDGLPATSQWVGNPVRAAITPSAKSQQQEINILVVGGSQGARSLNLHLAEVFRQQSAPINIWHQCGRNQREAVNDTYAAAGVPVKVTEFIDDMAAAYQWADLLICRAGAMTVAECCASALPALFVPYPFSAGDHQRLNAQALVDEGAARVIANNDLDKPLMVSELADLLSDPARLQDMGKAAHRLHKPNAVRDMVVICKEYLDA